MAKRKPKWYIKNPTTRKVLNRGYDIVQCHTDDGFRHGWLVKETKSIMSVAFPGAERLAHFRGPERRHVTIKQRA